MYENYKIYGPYTRADGRKHVILQHPSGEKKTVSYPKYLMELHLGRKLDSDETVDHIDRDFANNEISNLQVLKRSVHASLDAKRLVPMVFQCPQCGISFQLSGKRLSGVVRNKRRRRPTAGPFCSRSCTGKYGKSVQLDKKAILSCEIVESKFTTLKESQSLYEEIHKVDDAKTGKP